MADITTMTARTMKTIPNEPLDEGEGSCPSPLDPPVGRTMPGGGGPGGGKA